MTSLVRVTLESKLQAWAAAQTPPVPIAFENVPFTKPVSGIFLEPIFFSSVTINRNLGAMQTKDVGFLQVNCWAKNGQGMAEVDTLANNIVNLYPTLPKVGPVSIDGPAQSAQAKVDVSGWVCIPVTIKYRYETY
jgi:hypothetical protein